MGCRLHMPLLSAHGLLGVADGDVFTRGTSAETEDEGFCQKGALPPPCRRGLRLELFT